MTRVSHYLRTLFSFVFFALGGFVLSWIIIPCVWLITRDRHAAIRRSQRTLQWGFRLFVNVMSGLRLFKIDWPLRETITPDEPCVIICNHPCLVDTVLMTIRYNNVICLVKQSYYQNPLFFGLAKLCGYIPAGTEGSVRGHQRMVEEATEYLRQGYSVLAFPECRRTPMNGRLPFRRGPIEIAARAGVPIVPVQITLTPRTLTRELPLYGLPTERVRYAARQFPPMAVEPGRAATKAATQAVQNLLQPALSHAEGAPQIPAA